MREIRDTRGIKFYRQTVILGWIVDFWCPKLKLAIEVDGPTHEGREDYDENRALVMEEELGVTTIRFTNFDVINNRAMVKTRLLSEIKRLS